MRLQREIRSRFGITPPIRTGMPGVLRVTADGETVYDYKKEGARPDTEIVQRLAERTASAH